MRSIKGTVTAKCPEGCSPFETDLWTVINGAEDPEVKESIVSGEMNLVSCPECGKFFYPETPVVYMDAPAELLVFLFPESYAEQESKWRDKMLRDFTILKEGLFREMQIDFEPMIIFGLENMKELLVREQERADESDVLAASACVKGFGVRKIKPSVAREEGWPSYMVFSGDVCDKRSVLAASKEILAEHEAISSLKKFIDDVSLQAFLPPVI